MRAYWVAFVLVGAVACGDDTTGSNNNTLADMGSDAAVDAGIGSDGGSTTPDASTVPDSGPDASIRPDSGSDMGSDMGADVRPNEPPVADAGLDQTELKDRMVFLSASLSSDPDGDDLTYTWTQTAGEPVVLDTPNAVATNFVTPLVSGDLVFEVEVSDGLESATDSVTVTVTNRPPTANAGIGQQVQAGELVTLDGTPSDDPDGEPLTYSWTQISGEPVTLSDTSSAQPTFTAPAVFGAMLFELEVSDGEVSDTDRTQVEVLNLPPVAEAGADQNVAKGALVTLDGSASNDPEGLPLTYAWVQIDGPETVTLSDNTAVQPTFTAPSTAGGTYIFELVVNDGAADSAPDRVRVITPNDPPVADAGTGGPVNGGEVVFLDGRGSFDPDGDPFDYQWTQTAGTPVFFGDGDGARAYFKVPEGLSETLSFDLTVSNGQGTSTATVSYQTTAWAGTPVALPANPFADFLAPFRITTSLDVAGNFLAVSGSGTGAADDLQVYDITTPASPTLAAGIDAGGSVGQLLFDGNWVYANLNRGLTIFEFDDTAGTLSIVSSTSYPGTVNANHFALDGNTLYAAVFGSGNTAVLAYDVSNRSAPTLLHSQVFAQVTSLTARPGELWVGGLGTLDLYDTSSIGTATPSFVQLTDANDDSCPFAVRGLQIVGDYIYAACDLQLELAVFDISTPADPTLVASQNVNGAGSDIHVVGNRAYVAGDSAGVLVFDVTTPTAPTLLGSLPTTAGTLKARFANGYAFARAGSTGVDIIEEAFRTPEFAATVPIGLSAATMEYDSGRLAISASDLYIVDVADISNPQIVTTASVGAFGSIVFDYPWVYGSGSQIFRIIDVAIPSMPFTAATVVTNFNFEDIDVANDRLYAAIRDDGVAIWDVSNKSAPTNLGSYDPGTMRFEEVLADGTTVYGLAFGDGLHVIDASNPAAPTQVGFLSHTSPKGDLDKSGPYLWNGFGNVSYRRFDVSNPASIPSTFMDVGIGDVEQIRTNGALAWVAAGDAGVITVDASDPANPIVLELYGTTNDIDTLALADDDVWFSDGGNLRGIRIDNAQLGSRAVTAASGSTIAYPVTWSEPGTDAEVRCYVSGGSCSVTAFDGANRTATVSWDVPAAPGDHEIAIVVGHLATRAYLRDRISVQ